MGLVFCEELLGDCDDSAQESFPRMKKVVYFCYMVVSECCLGCQYLCLPQKDDDNNYEMITEIVNE